MRIAIFSDIHGNAVALDAVLADMERAGAERLVCLGDVAVTGPQPVGVVSRLRQLDCAFVQGNGDAWLLNPRPWKNGDDVSRAIQEIEQWSLTQLTQADLDFVGTFAPTVEMALPGERTLLCFHGSPERHTDILCATTPGEQVAALFANSKATVLAGGHTHEPLLRLIEDRLLLNPGSVGLPQRHVEGQAYNPLIAEYLILDADAGGMRFDFRQVPIEREALAAAVADSGMPHGEMWLADWR